MESSASPIKSSDHGFEHLASYHRCLADLVDRWPSFAARRRQQLQRGLFGAPVEKVAEEIMQDLFTEALDWALEDVVLQVGRADMMLTDMGVKRLVIEVKRPGALQWNRNAVNKALEQACGYAQEQRVNAVAVSDGDMLYVADVADGGLRPRVLARLDVAEPPESLWWVSRHGIYRPRPALSPDEDLPAESLDDRRSPLEPEALLHPKYHIPARCFAYVASVNDVHTWKLPYLHEDGRPDEKRLSGAIRSIISNYRGTRVGGIPRAAVPDVLVRLGIAAQQLGKLPCQHLGASSTYVDAHEALAQFGRLDEVGCCGSAGG